LPWSRLIADGQVATPDLNLSHRERLLAALALAVPFFALIGTLWHLGFLLALMAALLYILGNRPFFGFLAARLTARKLVIAIVMHWCYHIYSSVTFATVLLATKLAPRGR
jgi:hypothetical protein